MLLCPFADSWTWKCAPWCLRTRSLRSVTLRTSPPATLSSRTVPSLLHSSTTQVSRQLYCSKCSSSCQLLACSESSSLSDASIYCFLLLFFSTKKIAMRRSAIFGSLFQLYQWFLSFCRPSGRGRSRWQQWQLYYFVVHPHCVTTGEGPMRRFCSWDVAATTAAHWRWRRPHLLLALLAVLLFFFQQINQFSQRNPLEQEAV